MTQARDFADLLTADSKIASDKLDDNAVHGRRNLIINGGMNVAQRGTSTTGVTGFGYHSVDRFKTIMSSAGTFTISQSTEAPDGFKYSYKKECTTADASLAAANYNFLQYLIEGQDIQHLLYGNSGAKTLTISFWVRSSKTGTYNTELRIGSTTNYNTQQYTISAADTWEKKTINFVGSTANALSNNDSGIGLELNFWLGAGSTYSGGTTQGNTWHSTPNARAAGNVNLADTVGNDWYITGVQLEVGDKATPFEHRSFAEERLLCQRYYYTSWPYGTSTSTDLTGNDDNNGILMDINDSRITMGQAFLPVDMRVIPTVSVRSPSGVSGKFYDHQTDTDLGFSLTGSQIQASTSAITVYEYDGSATPQRPGFVHIFCDAELT